MANPETPLTLQSAVDLAAAISKGALSAEQVTGAFLERIDALNPTINAICTLAPDALDVARSVDQRLRSGAPARPLEGVPVVIKDNVPTAGLRTTYGSLTSSDFIPTEDAISVERLRAAGAVILGKSNTPEFAHDINTTNRVFGTTRNPWDLNRTAGGSSGGSGAALAADLAALAIGTDLGGSIRLPAALCGVAGIRPSYGRVPFYPTDFAWDTLVPHVHGPMARSVADVGLMLSVLAGPDDRDPASLPAPNHDYAATARPPNNPSAVLGQRRVRLCMDLGGLVPLDPEVERLVRAAAADLESLGCEVVEGSFDASDVAEIIACTRGFAVIARFAHHLREQPELLTDVIKPQIEAGLELTVERLAAGEAARTRYWHRVRAYAEGFDHIITPTIGAPGFRLDEPLPSTIGGRPVKRFHDIILTTYGFSVTGLPAMSVPCGFTAEGYPVGLQIVGPRLGEHRILEFAAAFQAARPEHYAKPNIDLGAALPLGDALKMPGLEMSR